MKRFSDENVRTNTPNCPKCGSHMIPRNGKSGKFWGCSQFPDCRGTRNSSGESKEEREDNKEDEPKWTRRYD